MEEITVRIAVCSDMLMWFSCMRKVLMKSAVDKNLLSS